MKTNRHRIYLERYAYPVEFLKNAPSPENPGLIVTIPCFAEENLLNTLTSLFNCHFPGCNVEIIIVINHPENSPVSIVSQNEKTWQEAVHWIKNNYKPWQLYHIIKAYDLPKKSAGVGLARKIGMDEAVRRYAMTGVGHGIISCFDADCQCDPTYFQAIINYFKEHPESNGGVIYFEHPITGNLDQKIYSGVTNYELHLRYLTNALRFAGFPYAFHTVGSTITVQSDVYEKQGGMNTRKAGEDFYFIQKIATLGDFDDITTTRIIPSPRVSDRVPFGTGKALKDWMAKPGGIFLTYNSLIFKDLKSFIKIITGSYNSDNPEDYFSRVNIPVSMASYLKNEGWQKKVSECLSSSKSEKVFLARLFRWFNGLKIIRFLNYSGKHFYPDINVQEASRWLLSEHFNINDQFTDSRGLLMKFREIDRKLGGY